MMSDTSVARVHVAGMATLIRSRHRDWTPAMVRSAIVTGASMLDNRGDEVQDDGPTPNAHVVTTSPFVAAAGLVHPACSTDMAWLYDYIDLM